MNLAQLEEMMTESGLASDDAAELATVLAPLAMTGPAPAPSAALATLFDEYVEESPFELVLRVRRSVRTAVTGAAVLAVSTVGATGISAAANTLPSDLQHHVSQFSQDYLPFEFPEPNDDAPLPLGSPQLLPGTDSRTGQEPSRAADDPRPWLLSPTYGPSAGPHASPGFAPAGGTYTVGGTAPPYAPGTATYGPAGFGAPSGSPSPSPSPSGSAYADPSGSPSASPTYAPSESPSESSSSGPLAAKPGGVRPAGGSKTPEPPTGNGLPSRGPDGQVTLPPPDLPTELPASLPPVVHPPDTTPDTTPSPTSITDPPATSGSGTTSPGPSYGTGNESSGSTPAESSGGSQSTPTGSSVGGGDLLPGGGVPSVTLPSIP